ncbi:type III secretion system chaperone family protein [Georgenia subflava]|uniref:DUF3137 domain-containing protein n=1 Tax=Georgenia subflava TaxID=1622177 RepID=A0A6N7EHH9_9MICO|nr:hypothetical protein [Georgenia subflava]MPV36438.1 hypothetical protein [Georgenia subflava]
MGFDVQALMPVLFFLLVAGVIGAMVLSVVATRKRRRLLQEWAARHGWNYADRDTGLTRGLSGGPFGRGHSRNANEIVSGGYSGQHAASFRYTYKVTTGSGKNRRTSTYHHHVVSIVLPVPLPTMELRPENLGRRIFNWGDVDFEHAAFNDAWHVTGEHPKTLSDVIHPRTMERLMHPDLQGKNLLIEDGRIFWWRSGSTDLDAIDAALRTLTELVALVPGFVWDDARARHRPLPG